MWEVVEVKKTFMLWAYAILLLAVPVAVGAAETEKSAAIKMNKPVDFPHAGIRIALPAGFEFQTLSEEFQVMVATRVEGRQATQSLSLSAYPVGGENVTAKEVLQRLLTPLKQDLAVRYLKVIKETRSRIAGIDGEARRLSYTYRGIKTVAVSACFIREVELDGAKAKTPSAPIASKLYVAYVLTMEVALDYEKKLLRTFDEVVRGVGLIDFQRPIDITTINFKGPFLKEFRKGYAIRVPKGWVGGLNELGVFIEQADYLLGGVASPSVQVVSAIIPEIMTARDCGKKAIEYEQNHGVKIEILSEAPTKLAGKGAYQYVLRKSIEPVPAGTQPATTPIKGRPSTRPSKTAAAAPIIEVRRGLCVPGRKKGEMRHYAIIVSCRDCDAKQAVEFMENLAAGFSLISIPVEKPEKE